MGYWHSRGLRGSTFEEIINYTNELYKKRGLAIIEKIPTPITPVKIDSANSTITLAYFDKKSTVDYIGVCQGIAICFDAKETNNKSLPIQNIHPHQIEFMDTFQKQKGISFLLVHFSRYGECYFLPFDVLKAYWDHVAKGGRKSIPYAAFDKGFLINDGKESFVHYIEALKKYKEHPNGGEHNVL